MCGFGGEYFRGVLGLGRGGLFGGYIRWCAVWVLSGVGLVRVLIPFAGGLWVFCVFGVV